MTDETIEVAYRLWDGFSKAGGGSQFTDSEMHDVIKAAFVAGAIAAGREPNGAAEQPHAQ